MQRSRSNTGDSLRAHNAQLLTELRNARVSSVSPLTTTSIKSSNPSSSGRSQQMEDGRTSRLPLQETISLSRPTYSSLLQVGDVYLSLFKCQKQWNCQIGLVCCSPKPFFKRFCCIYFNRNKSTAGWTRPCNRPNSFVNHPIWRAFGATCCEVVCVPKHPEYPLDRRFVSKRNFGNFVTTPSSSFSPSTVRKRFRFSSQKSLIMVRLSIDSQSDFTLFSRLGLVVALVYLLQNNQDLYISLPWPLRGDAAQLYPGADPQVKFEMEVDESALVGLPVTLGPATTAAVMVTASSGNNNTCLGRRSFVQYDPTTRLA